MKNGMRSGKRFAPVLLAAALFLLACFAAPFSLRSDAKSPNMKIGKIDLGYAPGDQYPDTRESMALTGTVQCAAFARYCQQVVYGCNDYNAPGKFRDIVGKKAPSECTAENMKKWFMGCAPATHLRCPGGTKSMHSMAIAETTEDVVHVIHGNWYPENIVAETFWSWEQFAGQAQARGGIVFAMSYTGEIPPEALEREDETTEPWEPANETTEPWDPEDETTEPWDPEDETTEPWEPADETTEPWEPVDETTEPWEPVDETTEPSAETEVSLWYEYDGLIIIDNFEEGWAEQHSTLRIYAQGLKGATRLVLTVGEIDPRLELDGFSSGLPAPEIGYENGVLTAAWRGSALPENGPVELLSAKASARNAVLEDLPMTARLEVADGIGAALPEPLEIGYHFNDEAKVSVSSGKLRTSGADETQYCTVTVSLDKNPGLASVSFDLDYDTSVFEVDRVEWGDVFDVCSTEGVYAYRCASKNDENVFDEGVLAKVTLKTKRAIDADDAGALTVGLDVNCQRFWEGHGLRSVKTPEPPERTIDVAIVEDAPGIAVSASEVDVRPGGTAEVEISVDTHGVGVQELLLSVSFDRAALTLTDEDLKTANTGLYDGDLIAKPTDEGILVAWMNDAPVAETGVLLKLRFAVNAAAGSYPVAVKVEQAWADPGTGVRFDTAAYSETVDGSVTVLGDAERLPGDVNGDGAVNGKDSTRLLQYLAEWDVEIDEAAADVNGDGTVNGKDSTRLLQYLAEWDVELGR